MSRLAGPSCRSILYCSPEQPPPPAATRSTPLGRPCRVNKPLTLPAAVGVNRIRRSSPTRKVGAATAVLLTLAIIRNYNHLSRKASGQQWLDDLALDVG